MPTKFLYNLTKNLTAFLPHNLCAVLPYIVLRFLHNISQLLPELFIGHDQFVTSCIACSTEAISIGLRISPTMMSNSSPDMRLSASAVWSQWRAELSPLRVDVSKPFEAMKVRFISRCVFMYLLLSYDLFATERATISSI